MTDLELLELAAKDEVIAEAGEMLAMRDRQLAANAALEAEVLRLREALTVCVCAMQDYQAGIGITEMFDKGELLGRKVLSTPFTPTAPYKLIEKVEKLTIERCAGECKTLDRKGNLHAAGYGIGYLTYTASDCEQIIRALPTGQIKLEELL